MSQAFVKESDGEWLHDLSPTLIALVNYLTRENNGIRVYEKSTTTNPADRKTLHLMSNGMSYSINSKGKWYMPEE